MLRLVEIRMDKILESLADFWKLLNWVDVGLLAVLIGAAFIGMSLGFYRQIALFASVSIGFIAATQFSSMLARADWFDGVRVDYGQDGAELAAYSSIILVCILLGLLSMLIFRSFFTRSLKILDSLAGAGMGIVLCSILLGVLMLGLFHFDSGFMHDPIRKSYLGAKFASGARVTASLFPREYRDRLVNNLGPEGQAVASEIFD